MNTATTQHSGLRKHSYKHESNLEKNDLLPGKQIVTKTQKLLDDRVKFAIIGNRVTKEFIYSLHLVEGLYKYRPKQFRTPIIRGVTSLDWPQVLNDLKNQYGSLAYCLKSEVAVLINDELLGGDNELKEYVESRYVYNLHLDYYTEGIKQFTNHIKSLGRPCAYLHISINKKEIGPLIFMLYADIVPRTCQNFLQMCQATKGGYGGTPVHRIVKDGWIQCGGFGLKSHNEVECENFIVSHDRRGVLCMANDGRHNDCSTQFFVLLQPAPWMKNKYVAFGQLSEGEKTLKSIENVPTWYESPMTDVIIYKCGILNLESHKMPVLKHACVHVDTRTEDINEIKELLCKIVIENAFRQINKNRIETKRNSPKNPTLALEVTGKDVRPAKSFLMKSKERDQHISKALDVGSSNTSESDESIENSVENLHMIQDDTQFQPTTVPRTVTSEEPTEIDSSFDLKKLLRGDYCLESDLEQDLVKRKQTNNIPAAIVSAVESYEKWDDESEYYLNQEDEESIKNYIREKTDKISFAGLVVKKIANEHQKFKIMFAKKVTKVHSLRETTSHDTYLRDTELIDKLQRSTSGQSDLKRLDNSIDLSLCVMTSDTIRTDSGDSSSVEKHFRYILEEIPSKAKFEYLRNRESILNTQRSHSIVKKRPSVSIAEYQLKNLKYKIECEKKLRILSQ